MEHRGIEGTTQNPDLTRTRPDNRRAWAAWFLQKGKQHICHGADEVRRRCRSSLARQCAAVRWQDLDVLLPLFEHAQIDLPILPWSKHSSPSKARNSLNLLVLSCFRFWKPLFTGLWQLAHTIKNLDCSASTCGEPLRHPKMGYPCTWFTPCFFSLLKMFKPQISTIPGSIYFQYPILGFFPQEKQFPALWPWGIEISTGTETARSMHAKFFGRTGCAWQSFLKNHQNRYPRVN